MVFFRVLYVVKRGNGYKDKTLIRINQNKSKEKLKKMKSFPKQKPNTFIHRRKNT